MKKLLKKARGFCERVSDVGGHGEPEFPSRKALALIEELCVAIEVDKCWRCCFCKSENVKSVGIGYIRCDDCKKLGN